MEVPDAVLDYFTSAQLEEVEKVAKLVVLMVDGRRATAKPAAPVATTPSQPELTPVRRRHGLGRPFRQKPDSIHALARRVLLDRKRPMSTNDLIEEIKRRFDRTIGVTVMRSELYKKSREGKFTRVAEGMFGLPEWETPTPAGDQSAEVGQ